MCSVPGVVNTPLQKAELFEITTSYPDRSKLSKASGYSSKKGWWLRVTSGNRCMNEVRTSRPRMVGDIFSGQYIEVYTGALGNSVCSSSRTRSAPPYWFR